VAYIEKRKYASGKLTYRARIRQAGAPDISATFATRNKALKWSQRMEAEIRAGRYFGRQEDKERTVGEFIDRYIEKELPKNPKAYKKQKQLLTWWKIHLGQYFLCYITPAMIAELRDKLMNEVTAKGSLRTSSTANRYLASLSRAFTICVQEWQWMKENPVLKIRRPKENRPKERYLDKEEIDRLLEACRRSKSPHIYAVVLFALGTGARKGEILNLQWDDIDFVRSTAIFRNTKNGSDRTVYLNKALLQCLMSEHKKRIILSKFVFPNLSGQRPADVKTAWERVVEDAKLTDGVSLHTLRHTVASHLAMGGYSMLEIGAILGHKSMSMIKRYSHLSTSSTAKALEKLNEDLFRVA
jgi:integrase